MAQRKQSMNTLNREGITATTPLRRGSDTTARRGTTGTVCLKSLTERISTTVSNNSTGTIETRFLPQPQWVSLGDGWYQTTHPETGTSSRAGLHSVLEAQHGQLCMCIYEPRSTEALHSCVYDSPEYNLEVSAKLISVAGKTSSASASSNSKHQGYAIIFAFKSTGDYFSLTCDVLGQKWLMCKHENDKEVVVAESVDETLKFNVFSSLLFQIRGSSVSVDVNTQPLFTAIRFSGGGRGTDGMGDMDSSLSGIVGIASKGSQCAIKGWKLRGFKQAAGFGPGSGSGNVVEGEKINAIISNTANSCIRNSKTVMEAIREIYVEDMNDALSIQESDKIESAINNRTSLWSMSDTIFQQDTPTSTTPSAPKRPVSLANIMARAQEEQRGGDAKDVPTSVARRPLSTMMRLGPPPVPLGGGGPGPTVAFSASQSSSISSFSSSSSSLSSSSSSSASDGTGTSHTPSTLLPGSNDGLNPQHSSTLLLANCASLLSQTHEKQIIDSVLRDVIQHNIAVKFDDIAALSTAKRLLNEAIVLPLLMPEFFTGIREPWKGVLLFGPPGNFCKYNISLQIARKIRFLCHLSHNITLLFMSFIVFILFLFYLDQNRYRQNHASKSSLWFQQINLFQLFIFISHFKVSRGE